jgi:hypothetical protein
MSCFLIIIAAILVALHFGLVVRAIGALVLLIILVALFA